jgi:hypothetical protein
MPVTPRGSLHCVRLLELPDLVLGQPDLDCGAGIHEPVRLSGSDDRRRHDRLGQQPGQRDLRHRDAPRLFNALDRVDDRLVDVRSKDFATTSTADRLVPRGG